MLRYTYRALARKAGSKGFAAASSAAVAAHTAPGTPPAGVSIPPIPGVRSARAFRSQKLAAVAPPPPTNSSKRIIIAKPSSHSKAVPKARPSKLTKMPKKVVAPAKESPAKRSRGPQSAAKEISKKAKAIKARK
ncbi:hypothetical protein LSCM1_02841 [Leishmania martiniquensis]|uniref:H1 histone-like protein n=1 Tax=Leishmania martiniquensis TaxID=1580590 RepID=A0A836KAT1_9TRYP|nr:hypothetical protein LSCM1_02841 [Leishmania martiniquensis]